MTGNGATGPVTLALVVIATAIVAILVGWMAGRGKQGRGLIAGAVAFVVLGGGGLLLVSRPSQPASNALAAPAPPASTPSPLIASKAAGGTLDPARKAPSVGTGDFMMLWMLPAAERVDFCTKRMKHFAQDCRDAVDGMAGMAPPTIPDDLRKHLTQAVKGDLLNRMTGYAADEAVARAKTGHPDEMLSFPSPGGTNADFYWCGEGDDGARYERAFNNALAVTSRAGLKLPNGVVIGRVRVIRTGEHLTGDVVEGDLDATAAKTILDLIRERNGASYTPGGKAKGSTLSFYVCK